MARITEYGDSGGSNPFEENQNSQQSQTEIISADQQGPVQVPSDDFISDAEITRDGQDLILEAPDGSVVVVEGYFNADPAPMIVAPDGSALTPKMVSSFVQNEGALEYARADSVVDESAVGHVQEVNGQANVIRADGSTEPLSVGMKIYQGDIIETSDDGAVNIQFSDDSTFAVSENARLAIDEYVFDPVTESGSTNFSVLRGLFVFTSGLIGRDDPDDVQIDTPVGSIGIRGTTIMGDLSTGEITVVEGAIVLRSFDGNEMTLDEQYETARFEPSTGGIVMVGVMSSEDMAANYGSMSGVLPALFSGFTGGTNSAGNAQAAPALVADSAPVNNEPSTDETQVAQAEPQQQQTAAPAPAPTAQPTTNTEPQAEVVPTAPVLDPFDVAANTGFSGAAGTGSTATGGTLGGTSTTGSGATAPANTGSSAGASVPPPPTTTTTTTAPPPATTTTTTPPPPAGTNTAPTISNPSTVFAIGEHAAGATTVGNVTASDIDVGQILSYSIISGNTGSAFSIDSSGNIVTSAPLDFEGISSYTLTVRVQDDGAGNLFDTATYTINVNDLNDAPVFTAPVSSNIAEGALSGAIVIDASSYASDVDAGQTLTYAITAGNTDGAFTIDANTGDITVVGGVLDFDALATSYNLTVQATDDGTGALTDSAVFTINITDDDDEAVSLDTNTGTNVAVGGNIILDVSMLSASDVDTADTSIVYTITNALMNGQLELLSAPGVPITSFTQQQLVNNDVTYIHDGSATSSDSFDFDVDDGVNGLTSSTFNITVADVTAPSLEAGGTGTQLSGLSSFAVIGTELHFRFNEDIVANTGNIYVREVSGGTTIYTISITDPNVIITGNIIKVTLNSSTVQSNTDYYVEMDADAVRDVAGNSYGGIMAPGTFNFTTGRDTFLTTVGGVGQDAAHDAIEIFDPSTNVSDGYIVVGEATTAGQKDVMITVVDNHGFVQDVQVLGENTSDEKAVGITYNTSGVFIGGTTNNAIGAGVDDFMLAKVDLDGNTLWAKTYGFAGIDTMSDVTSLGASQVVMAGTTQGTDDSGLIINVDGANGNILWETRLSEAGVDVQAEDVLSTSDAKYLSDVIVGANNTNNGGDIMLARLNDTDGSLQWAYDIDLAGATDETLNAMTETSDGGLIIAGSTTFGAGVRQGLLIKLATDGAGDNPTVAWSLSIGQVANVESINDVIELSDGTIAVVGQSDSEAFVANFDASGNLIWARSLSYTAQIAGAESIEQTADGTLLITGSTTAGITGNTDAFVFQMTTTGQIESQLGSHITNGTLGDGWNINDLGTIPVTSIVGSTIITANAAVAGVDPNATVGDWTGAATTSGDDVNHANDVLGTTNGGYQVSGDATANALSDGGNDVSISGFAGNDTITSNGFDIINGGSGDDVIIVNALGKYAPSSTISANQLGDIDGGVGNDVFRLESNNNLDLRFNQQNGAGLHNIETIDLTDGNSYAQTLTLSYQSIIAMTDANNELVINGTGADTVIADLIGAGFSAVDSSGGIYGAGYEHYTNGTVNLYIEDAVNQAAVAL